MSELRVPISADLYRRGGWLWVAPHASGDFANDLALLALYAARIAPLANDAPRALYAPMLFLVDRDDFKLDDVLRDAERYDHGFARMVHGAQGDAPQAGGGEPRDAIRLAWDDEQIARWFTRQVAADTGATMGTAGFRVNVHPAGDVGGWHLLQRMQSNGPLQLGAVGLRAFDSEGMVEVVPAQVSPARPGQYWMPAYFTAWRGASMVLTDTSLARLMQPLPGEAAPDPRFASLQLDREKVFSPLDDKAVVLRYGQRYDFRVRLVDLTCGGPAVDDPTPEPPDADAHVVATVAFRRNRPPGAVIVLQAPERGRATLAIEKPRLSFPEIIFASLVEENSVIDALRAARLADATAGLQREPGLPDPDVVSVDITLEVRALGGEHDTWHVLYSTTRAFADAVLKIPLAFQDHAVLTDFAAGPFADGDALPMPTARDLRLRLTAIGRADSDYFASDTARTGVTTSVEVRIDAATAATLFGTREDSLLGFFCRSPPDDSSTPPAVQRLAQELGLHNQGLALAGQAGRRTVFAATAALRHTLSPECSNITFRLKSTWRSTGSLR